MLVSQFHAHESYNFSNIVDYNKPRVHHVVSARPVGLVAQQAAFVLAVQLSRWFGGKYNATFDDAVDVATKMGIELQLFNNRAANRGTYIRRDDGRELILLNQAFPPATYAGTLIHELAERMVMQAQITGMKYTLSDASLAIPVHFYAGNAGFRHLIACIVQKLFVPDPAIQL